MALAFVIAPAAVRTTAPTLLRGSVSIWPLVTFRVLFGLVCAFGALRFVAEGWVGALLLEPGFTFDFYGFAWVPRPGPVAAYALYGIIAASALAVAAGWYFRLAAALLLVSFTYAELLDATNYLNHYYLVVLLAALLLFTPAHRALSLDVARGRVASAGRVPAWCVYALMAQLALVYGCAGLAKVNADWLLRAMPLAIWLPEHADLPLIGAWLAEPWVALAASWAACLYDLTIVGWLLWGRSRAWAYAAVVVFHGATWALFNIGLFPLIMTTGTLLFFPAAQHARAWAWIKVQLGQPLSLSGSTTTVAPALTGRAARLPPWTLGAFFAVQLALPLRALAYPGPAAWSEEGYRFGWRVMLVEKVGSARFSVSDAATGRRVEVDALDYLTPYQAKQMAIQPDFIWQFAQHLGEVYRREHGFTRPAVRVESFVSLNGRRSRRLIDPAVDLLAVRDGLAPKPWILPFE